MTAVAKRPAKTPTKSPLEAATPSGVQLQPKRIGEIKRRRSRLFLSFILVCFLPSVLGAIYYGRFASDRYVSGASFVVRGFDSGSGGTSDLVSSVTGLTSSGSTTSDSYIIRRYLLSPDLLVALDEDLDLQAHFGAEHIDPISRYHTDQPFEEFTKYWERRIKTTYDSTTGIVTFKVDAFDPQTSFKLANAVLAAADLLVNNLSTNARQDSIRFASAETERAEGRFLEAQLALRQFRATTGTVDPAINAQLDAQLIATLEGEWVDLQAQISSLKTRVAPGARTLTQLERRATALQAQINERRNAVGTGSSSNTNATNADALSRFEALKIEQTFAQQRYASALTSLEQARIDADRQQRYLAVFSNPMFPQDAIHPMRLRNSALIAFAFFVFWSISTLIVYAVRDHIR